MVFPLPGPKVFVNADATGRAIASGIVRENQCQMPDFRNHGIVPVASALPVASRMYVNVGDNSHVQLATPFPYQAEFSTIELHNAMREAPGIDIVVVEELLYLPDAILHCAEKESSTFAQSARPTIQLINARVPDGRMRDELRRPSGCRAQQRSK